MAERYYVSFSGGADSLALLHWAITHCSSVEAVHFEHGFRGQDSLDDQHFCERICRDWNVPLTVIPLAVPKNKLPGEGDEAAARRLRIAAWQSLIPELERDSSAVLLGHHADDAVETLLIRLFRGSNVSGLAGLRQERIISGIRFIRPLLHMTKNDISDYLNNLNLKEFCSDKTNFSNDYFRNYLRNTVLPGIAEKAPYAPGGLRRSLQNLSVDADCLEQMAEIAFQTCKNGRTKDWKGLHPAILIRVLRRFLPEGIVPDHHAAERLRQCLEHGGPETKFIPLNGQYQLAVDPERISLKELNQKENIEAWDWQKTPDFRNLHAEILEAAQVTDFSDSSAYFDAEKLPMRLYLTDWQSGDTVLSFDGKRKNLKKLFCDKHIPAQRRKVLRGADGTVYLAPGVRNSAEAPVTTSTKQILRITHHE